MPQRERTETIREFLLWMEAKSKGSGARIEEIFNHLEVEITDMGATQRTIRDYVSRCRAQGLIESKDDLRFVITSKGKNWLKRKI